jgi:hypothetical protein
MSNLTSLVSEPLDLIGVVQLELLAGAFLRPTLDPALTPPALPGVKGTLSSLEAYPGPSGQSRLQRECCALSVEWTIK